MTETTKEKKDVVPSQYREKYAETGGTCGDFIANELKKVTEDGPQALDTIFNENGLNELATRYAGFNIGMRRMNLSNVLRARFLKGETIKILGKEHSIRHVADDIGGLKEGDEKALGKLINNAGLQDNERTRAAIRKTFFSPPKKTAEERAAEKAQKDAAKQADKEAKAKVKADAKNAREAAAAQKKADKAKAKEEASA